MLKKTYLFCTIFIVWGFLLSTQAQLKRLDLKIDPSQTLSECLYSRVLFIDDRPESEKKKLKIDEDIFENHLNNLVCKDASSKKNLLVHLRKLYYKSEGSAYNNNLERNNGNYQIQMSIYETSEDADSSYYWINTLSRTMKVEKNDDQDQRKLSNLIVGFTQRGLDTIPQTRDYLLTDLDDVVAFEKEQIKLYQTDQYIDGIYENFASFSTQTPSLQTCSYNFKNSVLKEVKYIDPRSNKEKKIKKGEIYAVVINKEPFLVEAKKFMPIYKYEDNNLCITIKKTSTNSPGVAFGLIGAVLMPYDTTHETSEVMIDHLNGELSLKSKKIEKSRNHVFSKKPLSKNEKEVVGDGSNKKQW